MVVEQLEHVIKEDMVRKGKSLFGLVKVQPPLSSIIDDILL